MRRGKKQKGRGVPALILLAGLMMVLVGAGEKGEQCFGHTVPPFKEVFQKLFRLQVELMNLEQMKAVAAELPASERAAIAAFLGEEGSRKVREGLPPEKVAFLDEQYAAAAVGQEYDFKKVFPHILAVGNRHLSLEQFKETIARLTPEDIASQSFFLEDEGRAEFFSAMPPERIQIILDSSDEWVLLESGKRKYKEISTYTSIVFKQERLGDTLQDTEKIFLKYRENPRSIYMKWLEGPWTGRELVYNEKLLGAGKVRVRESGMLGVIPVTLPVDSEIAKRGTNHLVTEIGLKYLLEMMEFDYRKAAAKGEHQRKNHGIVKLDDRQVYKFESILPRDKSKGYYCYRLVHYIDYLRSIEIKVEIYNWDDELYESYYYTQIELNPPLSDRDFDPENPDYRLK